MERTTGYRVVAVLILLQSLADATGIWRIGLHAPIGVLPWWLYFGLVPEIVAVAAAVGLWSQRRWSTQAYAAWAILTALVLALAVVRPIIGLVMVGRLNQISSGPSPYPPLLGFLAVTGALAQLLVQVGVLGFGYWYLRATPPPPRPSDHLSNA